MSVLVLDFGSQVTQLIARRVREAGVYCEIVPYNKAEEALAKKPGAIILSGGPASAMEEGAPRAPQAVFEADVPVLGICYGEMEMAHRLGGKVEGGHHREFGRADIIIAKDSPLLAGLGAIGDREPVWMNHGDKITAIPPGFEVVATSDNSPYAVIADEKRRLYGIQFHPEVVHTPRGAQMIRNFVLDIAGITPDWNMHAFRAAMIDKIRKQVGTGKVICGLSGGVDSSVAAVLIHEAIGDQLTCIFVDTGLMRSGEADEVVSLFRNHYNIPLIHADARDMFLGRLAGVSDPEQKRKIIGAAFIDVFDAESHKVGGAEFLAQGTLYPDVIYLDEIRKAGLYDTIWQAFAVLLPVKTVGVMGDARTYDHVCALRAVTSSDGMTADYYPFEHSFLAKVATRIVNEVRGINRVVYDITSKPPGTIEWE